MTIFFEQLERFKDNVACIEGDTVLTYAQLGSKVEEKKIQLRNILVAAKDGENTGKNLLAIVAKNNISTMINYLAALQLKQAIIFLTNTDDKATEKSDLLTQFKPELILQNEQIIPSFVNSELEQPSIRDDVAVLLSTSGSTGESKQVVLSYDNLIANCQSICAYLPVQASDVTITTLPFLYSYGLSVINTHLACGASIVLTELSIMQREFWDCFERHQVTSFAGVPHSYDMLIRLKFTHKNMPHLRYFTQAGGKLSESNIVTLAEFAKRNNIEFYVMYGQTEATARMSFVSPNKLLQKPNTIGQAIPDCHLMLIDELGNEITHSQQQGQLVFQGRNVMLAYAEQRSELVNFEPIVALATGDIGYKDDDGDFFITGRIKRIVKLFGERVSLDQLEELVQRSIQKVTSVTQTTLLENISSDQEKPVNNDGKLYPAVSKVAVIGNDKKIIIVLELDAIADSSENLNVQSAITKLQQDLKKSLQSTTGIHPSALKVISIGSIPLSINGKTDYRSLKAKFMGVTLDEYKQNFELLMQADAFALDKKQKQNLLVPVLNSLHELHVANCPEYKRITAQAGYSFSTIEALPFIAVRLFKQHELSSISAQEIFKVLSSSGTTGQAPARILLDKETSARQSKTLVTILQSVIGKQRLPMLIIDSEAVAKGRSGFSARTAGIQGLSFFGRKHVYALRDDMSPNWEAIDAFFDEHGSGPILIFGFTFMLWEYLISPARDSAKSFKAQKAFVIHSGGWKKLESKRVDNATFKMACDEVVQGSQVHNFYGMAEQVGSIFIECEHGHLHAPNMADVIIRRPHDLAVASIGDIGLIQVLSALPTSYPGHTILTEDLGRILGEDNCPCLRKGKYFEVIGRLPKVEVRGCSDTHG
ncbi:AMP-binding protein [Brumicola nitratireducens]|uniref:AMP-dependent synthetase and ligase n=1 Tax=Glaciecola nitratireducens (strain JCM 12485 / KCTC 12276 / FR1064) TaxID=1085623 RepID=G4QLZ1_GLANF|nr:AMP-binding protein [Glaciecola nitratireducens]AEP30481.1 hypothetical protein GNIT_2384 [Glaciecola nitratireducens FR1064]